MAGGRESAAAAVQLGVDVGGTFTDLIALVDGEVRATKVPSTPGDQARGVMRAFADSGVDASAIALFAHGMTVATNALLERRGGRVALVTTEGFRDILEIGRQTRPSLYDLARDREPALVPRELRFTVRERTGPEGVVTPLDETHLQEVVARIAEVEVEAVAVCLLFAFLHPGHERLVGGALSGALPGTHVSLSSEVLPEFREYERCATTAANAYLAPRLSSYLASLAGQAEAAGMPRPRVMQSSGGVIELESAARHAASCVLSGPAGGVVGAAYAARASGFEDVLSFDMGGTSTDVAPIVGGAMLTTTESVVAGIPIRHPMVDVHTVSAGGGSIARADAGGALRVGPYSAGADPGPACYGRGGREATVTDANLFLGYLADGMRLGGEVTLSRECAAEALERVAAALGLDALDAALGVVRVTNAEMVRALRVISVERGLDPRGFALLAFGGAGGMHACALSEELGMATVLVPRASGVLSAFGLAISDLRRDYVKPLLRDLEALEAGELDAAFGPLAEQAVADLGEPRQRRQADLRYRRQSFELTVEAGDVPGLASAFHAAHERRHGYAMREEPVELVAVRLVATVEVDKPELRDAPGGRDAAAPASREANFDGKWMAVPVQRREHMGGGDAVAGPALVDFPEATCVVRPGWGGEIDDTGTLVLRRA